MAKRVRRGIDQWGTIRSMIAPALAHFRGRYPQSRRRAILEALAEAAAAEDEARLIRAGTAFFALTRVVPPGCYAHCPTREPKYFLAGERITGTRRGEAWSVQPYNYMV